MWILPYNYSKKSKSWNTEFLEFEKKFHNVNSLACTHAEWHLRPDHTLRVPATFSDYGCRNFKHLCWKQREPEVKFLRINQK